MYSNSQSTFVYVGPQAEPTRTEPADEGCWIDASAFMGDELNRRIISEMLDLHKVKFFVDTDMDRWCEIANKESADLTADDAEFLSSVADAAVDWLNEHKAGEGQMFTIVDNSLYLEPVEGYAAVLERAFGPESQVARDIADGRLPLRQPGEGELT